MSKERPTYDSKDIDAMIGILGRMLGSSDFEFDHMDRLMSHITDNRLYDPTEYCHSEHAWDVTYDAEDMVDKFMLNRCETEIEDKMAYFGFVPLIKGMKVDNYHDEDRAELISKIYEKFDSIWALEKFIGPELMAEFRDLKYVEVEEQGDLWDEEENTDDVDDGCLCIHVVNNHRDTIRDCATEKNLIGHDQWVGRENGKDFYQAVCPCGKVSVPFAK